MASASGTAKDEPIHGRGHRATRVPRVHLHLHRHRPRSPGRRRCLAAAAPASARHDPPATMASAESGPGLPTPPPPPPPPPLARRGRLVESPETEAVGAPTDRAPALRRSTGREIRRSTKVLLRMRQDRPRSRMKERMPSWIIQRVMAQGKEEEEKKSHPAKENLLAGVAFVLRIKATPRKWERTPCYLSKLLRLVSCFCLG